MPRQKAQSASALPVMTDWMMSCRGYSREEAESRMAAQMPVAEKAARSHYVIVNDGSAAELEREAEKFLDWLRSSL